MNDIVQVTTTLSEQEKAQELATVLVQEQWAACVQVQGPITSWYRWQGKIESAHEWRCTAKTRLNLVDQVMDRIKELHPYEQPEIIATPIVASSLGYQQWVDESCRSSGGRGD